MLNIRRNCFETNSSSMHSLVVVKEPKGYSKDDLKLRCWDSDSYQLFGYEDAEYGRSPFQVLNTPVDKLRYYVAHEIGNCEKYELIPEIKNFISEKTGIDIKKIDIRAREDSWGCRDSQKNDYYGYVEHNDTGESPFEFIKRNNITMEDFIMNPKYIVIIDGDEYQEFKKLFDSHVLSSDSLEDASSGLDFWMDATRYIYLNWIKGNHLTEEEFDDIINGMDKNTKNLDILVTDKEDEKCLRLKTTQIRIKDIIEKVKTTKPWVKVRLSHAKCVDLTDIKIVSDFDDIIINHNYDYEGD